MKPLIEIFLLIALLETMYSQTCKIFSCSNSMSNISASCLNTTVNSIIYGQCQSGQLCTQLTPNNLNNLTNNNCSNVKTNMYSNLQPGNLVDQDYCVLNTDCSSNNCDSSSKICKGFSTNLTCVNSKQCSGINFCNRTINKCQPRGGDGILCSDDSQCQNQYGCLNNRCFLLYNLSLGANTNNTNDSISSKFCFSGYSNKGICENLLLVSSVGNCNGGCQYISSISNTSVTRNCLCDFNGNSVCQKGTDSVEYSNYIKSLLNLYNVMVQNSVCSYFNKLRCALTDSTSWDLYNDALFTWNSIGKFSNYSCLATNFVFNSTYLSSEKLRVSIMTFLFVFTIYFLS